MVDQKLLLVSRDDILSAADSADGDRLFRALAKLTRGAFQLLATAPQPEDWSRDHGGPDDALLGPESIRKRLSDSGGVLDGVYYVPRSLMTQKRNREEALTDMMSRYSVTPSHCHLFSSSKKFVEAATGLGIQARHLSPDLHLLTELEKLIANNSL